MTYLSAKRIIGLSAITAYLFLFSGNMSAQIQEDTLTVPEIVPLSHHTIGGRSADTAYLHEPIQQTWLSDGHFIEDELLNTSWWKVFKDPLLDSLLDIGVSNNYDISMAIRRMQIAKAGIGSARAGYYPTVNVSTGWSGSRSSGAMESGNTPASYSRGWNLGATMSWEIDVFGKISSRVKQSKANYRASRAEYTGIMVSLRAQIAETYFQIRMWQAELTVAREHAERQFTVLNIARDRYAAGLASMLDVSQASTVYYSTIASIPMLENSIHTGINSLAVLMGEYPANFYTLLKDPKPMPELEYKIYTGLPMDLLGRRPDLIEARDKVDAAAAALGIARKEYLPSLTLEGSIGTSARNIDDMFKGNSYTYSIAPTLSWTVFDGLGRKYNVEQLRLELENSIDSYNLAVMNAVQETDNAMSTYINSLRHIQALEDVLKWSGEAEDKAIALYRSGLSSFTDVAQAMVSMLEAQNNSIAARGDALISLVTLYKALGGSWQTDTYVQKTLR